MKANKCLSKCLILLFIILILSMAFSQVVLAEKLIPGSYSDYQEKPSTTGTQIFLSKCENILGVIKNIGIVASVISLAIIGLRFMLGSTEEKAEYKKELLPYVIGCFILLSASAIVGFIQSSVGF